MLLCFVAALTATEMVSQTLVTMATPVTLVTAMATVMATVMAILTTDPFTEGITSEVRRTLCCCSLVVHHKQYRGRYVVSSWFENILFRYEVHIKNIGHGLKCDNTLPDVRLLEF